MSATFEKAYARERRTEMVWRCPRCGRVFRHHVFASATPASGPICNACCVPLEWSKVEVEVEVFRSEERRAGGGGESYGG